MLCSPDLHLFPLILAKLEPHSLRWKNVRLPHGSAAPSRYTSTFQRP
jgi:hypothetical protein